jgi:Host cell surface-exposed lipoprotein
MKKVFKWVLGACVVLIAISVVASAFSSGDDAASKKAPVEKVAQVEETAKSEDSAEKAEAVVEEAVVEEEAPAETAGQDNARRSAESYLDLTAFSRKGLIKQLSSEYGEGFSKADAVYAVNNIDVDWNKQAAKSAKSYLEISAFSRQGLIEQLESEAGEGFTHAQAVYGVNQTGL